MTAIGCAGLRIQLHQAVAGRDVEDALVAAAISPVGQAATGELTRRPAGGALALVHRIHPLHFAGLAVEGDDRAARAGGGVDRALDHDGRAFELVLGTRTEIIGLEPPGDFHLAEVAGADLVERRVLAAAQVGGVHRPLAIFRARLACILALDAWHEDRHAQSKQGNRRHNANRGALHHSTPH